MKPILFLIAVVLSGCASVQQPQSSSVEINKVTKPDFSAPVQDPIDQACAGFAKMTRAIAAVRDAGVPIADAPLVIGGVTEYPIGPIVREVYARGDISPADGATNSYQACRARSFGGMVEALKGAEAKYEESERVRIQAEYAKKKAAEPAKKKSKRKAK